MAADFMVSAPWLQTLWFQPHGYRLHGFSPMATDFVVSAPWLQTSGFRHCCRKNLSLLQAGWSITTGKLLALLQAGMEALLYVDIRGTKRLV